jgi:hypothetical protein
MLKRSDVLLGLLMVGLVSVAQAQSATGEKWRVTSSMEAMGMSMPPRTSEICRQAGSDTPPVSDDKSCQVSDMKRSGNTLTFKMHCTGRHAADGTMTMTYLGTDHYKGTMQMTADGQPVTMNYEGQKLGSCDGGEVNLQAKRMVDQANAQTAAMQQQQCAQAAEQATLPSMMASCKDPRDIQTYCSHFQTYSVFDQQAKMQQQMSQSGTAYGMSPPLDQSAQICSLKVATVRARLCASAEKDGQLDFLADQCPAEATTLAKAQCSGRSYTSMSSTYRGFCSRYATQSGDNGATATGKPAGGVVPALANDVTDKAKNTLKSLGGLFGH